MHELSIACNLVETADAAARTAGASRVRVVRLQIGAIAGIVEEALRFSFPIAAANTLLAQAELVVVPVTVQIYCAACDQPHTLEPPYVLRCPRCQSPANRLLHGRELQIESIEIEEKQEVEDATAYP